MIRRLLVLLTLGVGFIHLPLAAAELSGDELRVKERVVALSRGEGSLADLQIEIMDGTPMTLNGNRIHQIANGKVISQIWEHIGSSMKQNERAVTDEEVRKLLGELVEKQYWTFKGEMFIVDADQLMFRINYKDLPPVEYCCDAEQSRKSPSLAAIRSLLLKFISNTSPVDQSSP